MHYPITRQRGTCFMARIIRDNLTILHFQQRPSASVLPALPRGDKGQTYAQETA